MSIFSCLFSLAQENNDYFNAVAGDSAISLGKKLLKKNIGDTTRIKLGKGLYRIVFNKDIKISDRLNIQIINTKGEIVDSHHHKNFIDFENDSLGELGFIVATEKVTAQEIIGKFYWVYDMNVRRKAPGFDLMDIKGNSYTNENLIGKIVVFNFWGILCKPCRHEIPLLNRLVEKYADRDDIIFLAVSPDSPEDLKAFLQNTAFNYTLISNRNGGDLSDEMIKLGMIAVPSHAIIDKKGDVVFQYLGERQDIERILSTSIEKHQ